MSVGFYFHAVSSVAKSLKYSYDAVGLILLIVSKFISLCCWLCVLYIILYCDCDDYGISRGKKVPFICLLHQPALGYDEKKFKVGTELQDEMYISTEAGFPLYITWIFLSILDTSLFMYLPWVIDDSSSDWRIKGYPSLTLAKLCSYGFLCMQTVQSLSSALLLIGTTSPLFIYSCNESNCSL